MTKEEILEQHRAALGSKHMDLFRRIFYEAMDEYAKCWRERCLAAEDYISKSPGDPDITEAQIKAYEKWQRLVEADPEAKDERAEYAKQQAIDFAKWTAENLWTVYGDNWYPYQDEDNPIPANKLYDQFIESQNK